MTYWADYSALLARSIVCFGGKKPVLWVLKLLNWGLRATDGSVPLTAPVSFLCVRLAAWAVFAHLKGRRLIRELYPRVRLYH